MILRISKEVKDDSKRRGIITNRYTNPLKPNYKYIGNNEIFDCFGDRINNGNSTNKSEKLNKLNISWNNSKLKIYDEFQNQNNNSNNKFRYNNSNNLAYSHEFFNYPQSYRRNRKMIKSFSTNEMKSKFPFFNLRKNNNFNKEQSIRYNLFNENEKNESIDNYYDMPFPNYEKENDSFLKIGNINKNDRLDDKFRNDKRNQNLRELRQYYFRNSNYHDIAFNKINNSLNNKKLNLNDENYIINNEMNTIKHKLNKNENETNENKIDNFIKRNGA